MQPTASIHSFFKTRQNCCWKKWSALPGTKAAVREKSNVQHFFSIHPPSPPSARNRILLWDYKVLRQEACNGKAAGSSGTQWQQHILVLLIGGTSKYQKTDVSQQKWCLCFWVSLHALHRGYLHPQLLQAHTSGSCTGQNYTQRSAPAQGFMWLKTQQRFWFLIFDFDTN